MKFNPFSKSEESNKEEEVKDIARSAEKLGVIAEELFPVEDEIREQLEEVHELIDPETGGKFEVLMANPEGERGTIIVNSDFAADSENRPTKEFLAYMASLYPEYKVVFDVPPGYGTDPLKTFAEKEEVKRDTAFAVIAKPSLRALKQIDLGEDVVIFGASMGSHIATEQALVAEELGIPVKKVVLLAGPIEQRGAPVVREIRLTKAFSGDTKMSVDMVESSEYLKKVIPTQGEKNKNAIKHGLIGMKHMLKYTSDLADSQLEDALVELVTEHNDIDTEVIMGSDDSVARSSAYAGAIGRVKEKGKRLKRTIGVGWTHGTLADIPRRVVNVVPAIGRGGEKRLKNKTGL